MRADRRRRLAAERVGVALVINGRLHTWLRQVSSGQERIELAIARARAYLKAGASCIYPITLSDSDDIVALTRAIDGPVNVMMRVGVPPIAELEKLGVARVTFGSGLMLTKLRAHETHRPVDSDQWELRVPEREVDRPIAFSTRRGWVHH